MHAPDSCAGMHQEGGVRSKGRAAVRQPGLLQGQRLHGCWKLQHTQWHLRMRSRVCRPQMRYLPGTLQRHAEGVIVLQHRRCGQTRHLLQLRYPAHIFHYAVQ